MGSSNSKQQQRGSAPSTRGQRSSRGSSAAAAKATTKGASVPPSSSDSDPGAKISRNASNKERRGTGTVEVGGSLCEEGGIEKESAESVDSKKAVKEVKQSKDKTKASGKDSMEAKRDSNEKDSKKESKLESKKDSKKEAKKGSKKDKKAAKEKEEDNEKDEEEVSRLFRSLKAADIRPHIASGAVAKEWSELQREEMLDNRKVTVHMQKDRYYGRFVYDHSRVRLGGGFLNEDATLDDDEDAGSPPVSPIKVSEKDCIEAVEEEASEGLCDIEADSGSNELAAAISAGACKPKLNSSLPGIEEESSATVYSDCDGGKEFGTGIGVGGGAENDDGCEESSELFPSYSGSSEEDEDDEEEENDYINANFLADGKYICTQAPVPETLVDFWRMIWEQEVNLVVMLTRLEEGDRIKAHRYWPTMEKLYKSYKGQFQVTILSEKVLVEEQIVVRRFALKDVRVVIPLELSSEGEESDDETPAEDSDVAESNPALEDSDEEDVDPDARVVTQLHYIGWPDHGVPNNFVYILEMLKLVDGQQKKQQLLKEKEAREKANSKTTSALKRKASALKATKAARTLSAVPPIVVHCSAGVGRSGTFVVAHMELTRLRERYRERFGDGDVTEDRWKQILNEEDIHVGSAVKTLRRDRRTMVQREEQLLFLYELFEHMAGEGNSAVLPFAPSRDN